MNKFIYLSKGCCYTFFFFFFYQNLSLIVQSHFLYTWEGVTNRVGSHEPLLKFIRDKGGVPQARWVGVGYKYLVCWVIVLF